MREKKKKMFFLSSFDNFNAFQISANVHEYSKTFVECTCSTSNIACFFTYQHLPLFTKITILLGREREKKSKPSEDGEQKNALGRDASDEI